ncbi:uncharacterized protein LOC119080496 [Bradysia coprophila]|uniref:uncharacterized protein LOC119080496 n=1 Tax=Bradysia coprophila TaxID=38358 RepID=UPI00187DC0F5|nr:uncharacterized protein LOC119080496 [Bradysia coprophila]
MNFWFVILWACISPIIIVSGNPQSPQKAVFDGFSEAIDSYSRNLDRSINWTEIDATTKNLHDNKRFFSTSSGMILGEIVTKINYAKDSYDGASREIFHWCESSRGSISGYVQLFAKTNDDIIIPTTLIADAQKTLLNLILTTGVAKMENSITKIEDAQRFLSEASGKFSELDVSVTNDGKEKVEALENAIANKRKSSIDTIAMSPLVGLIQLIVTEADTVPKLRESIESTKKVFEAFGEKIDKAIVAITVAKSAMKKELDNIVDLKASTETTQNFLNLPVFVVQTIRASGQELLDRCQSFQRRHRT